MEKWKGKVAVVTGASAGIGAAIVEDLAREGLVVVALARRPQKIEENVKDFPESYGKVHARSCDVANLDSIKEAFAWIADKFGFINVLVNNAGIGRFVEIHRHSVLKSIVTGFSVVCPNILQNAFIKSERNSKIVKFTKIFFKFSRKIFLLIF